MKRENKGIYQSIWSLKGMPSRPRDDVMALAFVLLHLVSDISEDKTLLFNDIRTLNDLNYQLKAKQSFLDSKPDKSHGPIRRVHSLLTQINLLQLDERPNYETL